MAGKLNVTLDCLEWQDLNDMHNTFRLVLDFPDHYGANFDALHDLLTSLPPTELTLLHTGCLAERLGPKGPILLRVLADSAMENGNLSVTLKL